MCVNRFASLVLRLPFATLLAAGCLLTTLSVADDYALQHPLLDDAQSIDFSFKDYDLAPGQTFADSGRGQSFYDRNKQQRTPSDRGSSLQRSQGSQQRDSRDRRGSYDYYYQRSNQGSSSGTYRDQDYRNRNTNNSDDDNSNVGGYNQYQYYPYDYERGLSRQYDGGRLPYYRSHEYRSTYGARDVDQATSPASKYYWWR